MANIIAVANQKGGVGKTTTAVNLAASLAAAERRVLLVDLDPQGNASSGLGVERDTYGDKNIYQVIVDELPVGEAIYPTDMKFLKVCPADNNLSGAEIELVQAIARELRLKNAFDDFSKPDGPQFDYVVIDCPPSLGLLTLNALAASNFYMIPLQCEYYAMEGLGQFLNTVELVRKGINRDLKQLGIVLTMFDSRNNLSRQVVKEVKEHFEDTFETIIPRNVKLSESPSHGKPALLYDISSTGSQSYLNLAKEVMDRLEPKAEAAEPEGGDVVVPVGAAPEAPEPPVLHASPETEAAPSPAPQETSPAQTPDAVTPEEPVTVEAKESAPGSDGAPETAEKEELTVSQEDEEPSSPSVEDSLPPIVHPTPTRRVEAEEHSDLDEISATEELPEGPPPTEPGAPETRRDNDHGLN